MKTIVIAIVRRLITWFNIPPAVFGSVPGDWMKPTSTEKAISATPSNSAYDPDAEFELISNTPVENPVLRLHKEVLNGTARVREAWLFEGRFDERGKLMEASRTAIPYRVRFVRDHDQFVAALHESEERFKWIPEQAKLAREAKERVLELVDRAKKSPLFTEGDFDYDQASTQYDPGQYTEYTTTYGGPFNKQLYLTDYLLMHARAFEAHNHNPIAKRIVDVLRQYSFGRRFKVRVNDAKKKKAWDNFEKENNIIHKMSEFWVKEYLIYGELMINKANWQSIDPSTVWDIVTDPDDITNVYYYYQSYPTAFQTFTGYRVTGAPGAQDAKPIEYVVRQLPARQVMHIKGNVVSQEKRGRSVLFPVLGWLKRIKDLYNFQVLRTQIEATFVFDDTIEGSDADVQAHAARYARLPVQPTVFAHNTKITRQAMPAMSGAGRTNSGTGDEILALIATAIGIPKDFFNIIASGGGNRATALVGAEPFEKVIEDIQAKFEKVLLDIAEEAIEAAGLDYEQGDVEFVFPSVTKDTTSETVKNIAMGETMSWLDKQTAAEMYAGELNITTYDYDEIKKKIAQQPKEEVPPLPPAGRFGNNGTVSDDQSPIHGNGKVALKGQINSL